MIPIPVLALGTKLAGARGVVPITVKKLLFEVVPLGVRLLPLVLERNRGGGGATTREIGWIRRTGTGRRRRSRRPQRFVGRRYYRRRSRHRAVRAQSAVGARVHSFGRSPAFVQLCGGKRDQAIETRADAILPIGLSVCKNKSQLCGRSVAR